MENLLIFTALGLTAALLIWPRLANATLWRAMSTPLASIIGSGFLVLGPILIASYGQYAPVAMLALCGFAYLFGATIRFNIAAIQSGNRPRMARRFEVLASWLLSFAYIISVAYYLNLLGAFAVRLTPFDSPLNARLLTSAIYAVILITGWFYGFAALERLEQISVSIKLAVIAGLLAALGYFFAGQMAQDALILSPVSLTGWPALTLAFGLLISVQGFETSRYLGDEYNARTRIRSMRLAQALASVIYMIYILLLAYVFAPDQQHLSETAIIDMMQIVAPVLPFLLVIAALSAQFSAAIADTSGAGGLLEELTGNRMQPRYAYLLLVLVGLGLTWGANVFEIIAYASRAFALYYGVQALIAALTAQRGGKAWLFAALAVFGFMVAIFGHAVEGH